MTHAVYYPYANRTAQWYGEGNFTMPKISKYLLHTTETLGWPSYNGGAKAPTITVNPTVKQIRQHFPLNGSARALADPTGTPVRENRDNIVQVEICWYASKITSLPTWALEAVADIAAFLNKEWELPLTARDLKWYPFPQTQAQFNEVSMTSAEFDAYTGILGHVHASGNINEHGDPGAIAISKIIQLAQDKVGLPVSEITPTTEANWLSRLHWLYLAAIDGDGSDATNTMLNRLEDEATKQTALLTEIRDLLKAQ